MQVGEVDLLVMGCLLCEIEICVELFVVYLLVFVVVFDYLLVCMEVIVLDIFVVYFFVVCEEGLGMCVVMQVFFEEYWLELWVVMEVVSNEMVKYVVMVGLGLSLFLLYMIGLEL